MKLASFTHPLEMPMITRRAAQMILSILLLTSSHGGRVLASSSKSGGSPTEPLAAFSEEVRAELLHVMNVILKEEGVRQSREAREARRPVIETVNEAVETGLRNLFRSLLERELRELSFEGLSTVLHPTIVSANGEPRPLSSGIRMTFRQNPEGRLRPNEIEPVFLKTKVVNGYDQRK